MARVHGQSSRVYVDQYNLSGRVNKVELAFDVDTPEVTCFEDTGKAFVVGKAQWEADYEGFSDYTAAEIDSIIAALGTTSHTIEIYFAGAAAAGYSGVGMLKMQSRTSEIADAAKLKFKLVGAEGTMLARGGSLLNNGLAVTGTGAQTGVSTVTATAGQLVRLTSTIVAVSGSGSITVAAQESSDGSGDPYATAIAGTAQTAVGSVVSTAVAGGTLGPFWRTNVTAFSGFTSVTLRTSITVLG
jgi:hypothetical protein